SAETKAGARNRDLSRHHVIIRRLSLPAESEVVPGCTRLKTALFRHQQFKCGSLLFRK
ncbi:MAG: hypothetical protein QOH85_1925, partial [Acidobacteriaceae bacterium]|nr:hypothetical protein [Acidobacteriaceae bacterium]